MSKRPMSAEGPALDSSHLSTASKDGPPLKCPKLAASPLITVSDSIDLDSDPVSQCPEVPVKSVDNLKNVVHCANKEETVTADPQAKVPECERKNSEVETLKNAGKRPSWASNYLSSIGISYNKPIKINLTSIKNATTAELSKSNENVEEKKIESKNFNECSSQQPCHSSVTINDSPTVQIYSSGSRIQNETHFYPNPDIKGIGNIFIPRTSLLPYFDNIHYEPIQIPNENLPYLNYCPRHFCYEQPFHNTLSFTEFDRLQNLSFNYNSHRPVEDRSYLDKVDQFLAKISKDKDEIERHKDINVKNRSLSLKHRNVKNDIKNNVENKPDIKTADFEIHHRHIEKEQRRNDVLFELRERERLRMSERFYDAEINNRPSTSKFNYDIFKDRNYDNASKPRSENIGFENEFKTRDSRIRQHNMSRAEHFQARSPNYIPRYQGNNTYKTRLRSNSSSSERGRSPHYNEHKIITPKKIRPDSKSQSKIDRGYTPPLKYKKCDKTSQSKDRSCSSHSDRSGQHISHDDKYKTHTKHRPSPNIKSSCHFEKLRNRSSCETQRPLKRKKSYSSSDSSACCDRVSQVNKRNKTKKESSSSSTESDNFQDTSTRQSSKKEKSKKAIKEKCNSKDRTENCRSKPFYDSIKCRDSKSKIREKSIKSYVPTKNKYRISPDAKKTYRLIKEIISKDKVKRKLIKSLIIHKSSLNSIVEDNNNNPVSSSNTKQKTKNIGSLEKYSNKKQNGAEEMKLSHPSAPMKSAVLVKDNVEQNRQSNLGKVEMENFDLRSKLSRKNLNQFITKIRNEKRIEKEAQVREKSIVTVDNQNQKEKIKTEINKLISQEDSDKLTAKKGKKIKLVINVICESSDDDCNVEEAHKENNSDDVNAERASSSGELSFLDDLNIDEIVDSLTHIKNEPGASKDCVDATIENKILIDLCDLISSSDDSDASTVHLEDLCEMNDNIADCNKNGNPNKNKIRNKRIDAGSQKSQPKYLAQSCINIDNVTPVETEPLNENTTVSARKTMQETESKHIQNNTLHAKETKEKEVNKGLKGIIKMEAESYETGSNVMFTSTVKDKKVINDNYKQNSVSPLIEVNDEPVDLDTDITIPVIEIKDEPLDLDTDNTVHVIEIKDEPFDKNENKERTIIREEIVSVKEIKTRRTGEFAFKQSSSISSLQVMNNKKLLPENENETINNNKPVIWEIKDEPIDAVLSVEIKTAGTELNLGPTNKIKNEMQDEDSRGLMEINTTHKLDIIKNKSCLQRLITKQQNISTESIAKFTELNETYMGSSVNNSDKIINSINLVNKIEGKSHKTSTTAIVCNYCTENANSNYLNNTDLQTLKGTPLDKNMSNKVQRDNSTTGISTHTENSKDLQVLSKLSKTTKEDDVLEIEPSIKNKNKVSERSKSESRNVNSRNPVNGSKCDGKKITHKGTPLDKKLSIKVQSNNNSTTGTSINTENSKDVQVLSKLSENDVLEIEPSKNNNSEVSERSEREKSRNVNARNLINVSKCDRKKITPKCTHLNKNMSKNVQSNINSTIGTSTHTENTKDLQVLLSMLTEGDNENDVIEIEPSKTNNDKVSETPKSDNSRNDNATNLINDPKCDGKKITPKGTPLDKNLSIKVQSNIKSTTATSNHTENTKDLQVLISMLTEDDKENDVIEIEHSEKKYDKVFETPKWDSSRNDGATNPINNPKCDGKKITPEGTPLHKNLSKKVQSNINSTTATSNHTENTKDLQVLISMLTEDDKENDVIEIEHSKKKYDKVFETPKWDNSRNDDATNPINNPKCDGKKITPEGTPLHKNLSKKVQSNINSTTGTSTHTENTKNLQELLSMSTEDDKEKNVIEIKHSKKNNDEVSERSECDNSRNVNASNPFNDLKCDGKKITPKSTPLDQNLSNKSSTTGISAHRENTKDLQILLSMLTENDKNMDVLEIEPSKKNNDVLSKRSKLDNSRNDNATNPVKDPKSDGKKSKPKGVPLEKNPCNKIQSNINITTGTSAHRENRKDLKVLSKLSENAKGNDVLQIELSKKYNDKVSERSKWDNSRNISAKKPMNEPKSDGKKIKPKGVPLEKKVSNKVQSHINSTTGTLTRTKNTKDLQVVSKLTENAKESNVLEVEPSKKNNSDVSEKSKGDNLRNINKSNLNNNPKCDEKKVTLTNKQKCKTTEKNNVAAEVETVNKSCGHSPIRIKTPKPTIESDKNPEPKGKSLAQNLEERLSKYLREPITVTSLIHKGKFSDIFHCQCSVGKDYAIKMLSFEKNGCAKGLVKERNLKSLQLDIPNENLNFVRVIDGLAVAGRWCFLMDFYPKNLSQYLEENGSSLHVNHVQNLSRQLLAAVTVLRHKNVVHSDIKPSHVLLNSTNDRLKLCGFDSAYQIGQVEMLPNIGTANYRAPEIILGHSAGYSIDVWSTALVMFEMATRRHLFPGKVNNDILFKQMCTVGFVPMDMIVQSRYGHKHFSGRLFKRWALGQTYQHTLLGENVIYRNNILRSTVHTTYQKEWWPKCTNRKQKNEELCKVESFCKLLEEMLIIHPTNRLPIELVYTNPYLFESSQDVIV